MRELALALVLVLAWVEGSPRSHPVPARQPRTCALRGGGPCLPSAAAGLDLACATTAGNEAGPDPPPSPPGDADPEAEHILPPSGSDDSAGERQQREVRARQDGDEVHPPTDAQQARGVMAAGPQGALSPAQLAALAGRMGGGGALLRVLQSWEQATAQSPAQMIPEPSTLWQTHDLTAFEDMLRDSPKDADIWSAYGHAHLAGHNDHTRAVEAYSRAIELAPSHSFALNNLGYILMKHRNDLAAAEGCFRKVLQVAPADVNTNVNLAVLLSAHRQPPDYNTAAECYQRALAVDDKHLGALVNYANFLVERPLPELDAEAADAAAAAGATNARCTEGMNPSALRALRKAAREGSETGERPDGPVLREGQKDDSGEGGGYTWEELKRERPRVEEKAAEAAVTYWIGKAQDWNAAALYYERALEVDPGSADAMCGFASLKRHEDDAQGAESLYRSALVANPLHFESRSQYGLLLHKQNLLQRAREQYEKALAINPQDPMTCLHLAALLEMVHAPVHEIVRLYKQILILQPVRADIYHSLGRVLQESGKDMQGAKDMFELALDYNPRDVSSLNSLAPISQYQIRFSKFFFNQKKLVSSLTSLALIFQKIFFSKKKTGELAQQSRSHLAIRNLFSKIFFFKKNR
jgi:tetratricopeptide (TPR) repeat protein